MNGTNPTVLSFSTIPLRASRSTRMRPHLSYVSCNLAWGNTFTGTFTTRGPHSHECSKTGQYCANPNFLGRWNLDRQLRRPVHTPHGYPTQGRAKCEHDSITAGRSKWFSSNGHFRTRNSDSGTTLRAVAMWTKMLLSRYEKAEFFLQPDIGRGSRRNSIGLSDVFKGSRAANFNKSGATVREWASESDNKHILAHVSAVFPLTTLPKQSEHWLSVSSSGVCLYSDAVIEVPTAWHLHCTRRSEERERLRKKERDHTGNWSTLGNRRIQYWKDIIASRITISIGKGIKGKRPIREPVKSTGHVASYSLLVTKGPDTGVCVYVEKFPGASFSHTYPWWKMRCWAIGKIFHIQRMPWLHESNVVCLTSPRRHQWINSDPRRNHDRKYQHRREWVIYGETAEDPAWPGMIQKELGEYLKRREENHWSSKYKLCL